MKIKKSQLRRIIKEERQKLLRESMSYDDSMARVDQILSAIDQAQGYLKVFDDLVDDLLAIVGNDGSLETHEAREAIMALQNRDGGTSIRDVESYISAALRDQGTIR
jgi:hypothetical protein